jgi:hypothetical protein
LFILYSHDSSLVGFDVSATRALSCRRTELMLVPFLYISMWKACIMHKKLNNMYMYSYFRTLGMAGRNRIHTNYDTWGTLHRTGILQMCKGGYLPPVATGSWSDIMMWKRNTGLTSNFGQFTLQIAHLYRNLMYCIQDINTRM